MQYILAIDQGTTGTKVVLVNASNFNFLDSESQEFPQIFPRPSWVEHNLNDIWGTTQQIIKRLLERNNIDKNKIMAIGITNQRETTCAFSPEGVPLANAIVWQDRRTETFCKTLKDQGHEKSVKEITGLPIDPYFSATKMNWLLENNEQVKLASKNNQLHFGTIDTFLVYKLTGHKSFVTEASNASRTLLMNLKTCRWDSKMLTLFGISESSLPEIKSSFGEFGKTHNLDCLPDGIPITGILGDQQAALFGQGGFSKGGMKVTYGTGSFILLNTGNELVYSESGLLTTVAYKDNQNTFYAIEGSCYIAGAAVQWLRDKLGIIPNSPAVEELASSISNMDEMEHVLFLPFFTGIGSPYWVSEAKAAIVGLTRDTNKAHIARACLEGIALSINDLVNAMKKDSHMEITNLKVDGGATANNLLMNMQATISKLEIIRPKITETTAYGAALAAAIGASQLKYNDISNYWHSDKTFTPDQNLIPFYQTKSKQWSTYIKKLYL